MKKTTLYSLAIASCLCLLSTTSKECGKIIKDRMSVEASNDKKEETRQKEESKENVQTEFSLINTLFFQTT
ncbi:MAG TPA: hypothetical protein VKT28_20185 [Puia sp.]|nr:hypothetical protein [Puia sp.]